MLLKTEAETKWGHTETPPYSPAGLKATRVLQRFTAAHSSQDSNYFKCSWQSKVPLRSFPEHVTSVLLCSHFIKTYKNMSFHKNIPDFDTGQRHLSVGLHSKLFAFKRVAHTIPHSWSVKCESFRIENTTHFIPTSYTSQLPTFFLFSLFSFSCKTLLFYGELKNTHK